MTQSCPARDCPPCYHRCWSGCRRCRNWRRGLEVGQTALPMPRSCREELSSNCQSVASNRLRLKIWEQDLLRWRTGLTRCRRKYRRQKPRENKCDRTYNTMYKLDIVNQLCTDVKLLGRIMQPANGVTINFFLPDIMDSVQQYRK